MGSTVVTNMGANCGLLLFLGVRAPVNARGQRKFRPSVRGLINLFGNATGARLYTRDAILAHGISCCPVCVCVCVRVCHKTVLYSETDGRNDLGVLARMLRSTCYIPHRVLRKFKYLQKIRVLPSGTLSSTLNVANFATASRSCCRRSSFSISTAPTTVDAQWQTVERRICCTSVDRNTEHCTLLRMRRMCIHRPV